jgi:quercetin dioxygenase-like cupin family protein
VKRSFTFLANLRERELRNKKRRLKGESMKVTNFKDVETKEVSAPGASGVAIRWLISEEDGAPNFALRLFEVNPGGHTPYHHHKWEHEVFVLKGRGDLVTESGNLPLNVGDSVLVPEGQNHQFKSASDETLVFLCAVPHSGCRSVSRKCG